MKKWTIIGVASIAAIAVLIGCIFIFKPDTDEPEKEVLQIAGDEFPQNIRAEYGYSADRDSDGDTLNDYEEYHTYNTNAFHLDTDSDGLADNREVEIGTDPLKNDTDRDGVMDGTEVRAGTDPLKADDDTSFNLTLKTENDTSATFDIKGNASIYDATFQKFNAAGITTTPGVLSDAYWVYVPSKGKGLLSIEISVPEQEVAIYRFNDNMSFTKVETNVSEQGNVHHLTANVGNGKYLAGICSILDNFKENKEAIDVFLLLDDSGSMYNEYMDGAGNDPEYKRIDMCTQLLQNAPAGFRFGLATFTADYMEKSKITDSRADVLASLNLVKNTPVEEKQSQFNGTYISTSIYHALDNFSADSDRRQFIVLLTDGETTEMHGIGAIFSDAKKLEDTIRKAQQKNVSVIVVALGREVNVQYLSAIESGTNGSYIHANNADAMDDLYNAILDAAHLNLVDQNKDGEYDSLSVADSGFRAEVNGLPIRNCLVKGIDYECLGICYGISSFVSLYYQEKLPTSMDDMSRTDWNLWALRLLYPEATQPVRIQGYDANSLVQAGLATDTSGALNYSFDLGKWNSKIMRRYGEYFAWTLSSTYYKKGTSTTAALDVNMFSQKGMDIINGEEFMDVTIVGKTAYPILDLSADFASLSDDGQKTMALLRILMRYQVTQYDTPTFENYVYYFTNDFSIIEHSLNSGIPLMLVTSNHAVNVCRIRQNLTNPNLFYLDLYDSNYCGETTTMNAEIKMDADGNRYAEFEYQGEKFTDVAFRDPHI